ncbi:polysaccharide pyruvyl transferase family protein [Pelagibius sp. Alg239-R121]|uniref:polysaccharide pyruvyl transferase family protein n=1 Tax=Pelagibius sp. Alg239-R121 TaxID=2993448 RepID=UPI0024A75C40|nr:polysaccharide pyruvyl transferase family protein [Pelagibius sp. Alg239-R121]
MFSPEVIRTHEKIMYGLKDKLNIITEEIPKSSRVVRLDLPMHLNIGDQLIDWGTETFLESQNIHPSLRLSALDYQRYRHKIRPSDILLLHGGGNVNDIYKWHENLRQDVLKRFPQNKIILFPQSVFFFDSERGKELMKSYQNHENFMMFVRDQESYDYIQQLGGIRCELCPDMAHALWKSKKGVHPHYDGQQKLLFLRKDVEAAESQEKNGQSIDWVDITHPLDRSISQHLFAAIERCPSFVMRNRIVDVWNFRKNRIIAKSIKTFSAYETIETDRLHAMILGCLLGKSVNYIDNNYGKLSRYESLWLRDTASKMKKQ